MTIIIRAEQHQKPFVKLWHNEFHQYWYLGYSTHFKQFVAYSNEYGEGSYKRKDTIEELRDLYKWFIKKGYSVCEVYNDNIEKYVR